MPSWNEVLVEMSQVNADIVRRNYLKALSQKTGRNVIAYYSGFLKIDSRDAWIIDNDINGFLNAVHGLDCSTGLDLILHTPGGGVSAAACIVNYLRSKFGLDIRCFVPQIAMSAGTMLACACKEIYMGKQSSIGPIDPQINGISTHGVIEEFENAIQGVKNDPKSMPIWQTVVNKYRPSFIGECQKAIDFSDSLVTEWLTTGMFKEEPDAKLKAKKVLSHFGSHAKTLQHDRHISIAEAKENGLPIRALEDDNELQDMVLTVHHAFMCSFSKASKAIKIIENQEGKASIDFVLAR